MKVYAGYDFYSYNYNGVKIKPEDFDAAALHATQYIKHITLGRSDGYDGDELKYATCEIAEVYAELFVFKTGNEIKSENTDGYSVSYVTQGRDGESREDLFRRRAYAIANKWLSLTGLLYRGICR